MPKRFQLSQDHRTCTIPDLVISGLLGHMCWYGFGRVEPSTPPRLYQSAGQFLHVAVASSSLCLPAAQLSHPSLAAFTFAPAVHFAHAAALPALLHAAVLLQGVTNNTQNTQKTPGGPHSRNMQNAHKSLRPIQEKFAACAHKRLGTTMGQSMA